ncbi:hypothetical protein YA50_22940 [Enterobacter kobei]|nr:hypothetical protein YA50_22940 [Enterobacter kobei]
MEYLDLFHEEGIGGAGFHECLNFSVRSNAPTKIYLPPTCIPSDKYLDEEIVFFSFTYKYDKEMPSSIIGVHAAARLVTNGKDSISRNDIEKIEGAEQFHYHAEAPSEFTTLITPTIKYDFKDGIYTPEYSSWGYGLRYITEEHAANIIDAALSGAIKRLSATTVSESIILEREISVLEAIQRRYALPSSQINSQQKKTDTSNSGWNNTPPDKEIGFLGEAFIYEQEVAYAVKNGIPISEVEWVSQSDPQSPYDIKSVRITPNGKQEHFIEVKSSRSINESNIYISSRQVKFFQENESNSILKFVTFISNNQVDTVEEYSFQRLMNEFELAPIKFKLKKLKQQ